MEDEKVGLLVDGLELGNVLNIYDIVRLEKMIFIQKITLVPIV